MQKYSSDERRGYSIRFSSSRREGQRGAATAARYLGVFNAPLKDFLRGFELFNRIFKFSTRPYFTERGNLRGGAFTKIWERLVFNRNGKSEWYKGYTKSDSINIRCNIAEGLFTFQIEVKINSIRFIFKRKYWVICKAVLKAWTIHISDVSKLIVT